MNFTKCQNYNLFLKYQINYQSHKYRHFQLFILWRSVLLREDIRKI